MGKKFRTASLNSKFTGSYKKVYPNANLLTKLLTLAQKNYRPIIFLVLQ